MFGISFAEVFIVLIVLFIFFKPKEIILIASQIVLFYEKLKDELFYLKSEIVLNQEDEESMKEVKESKMAEEKE
jgi:Sec-independent protein translocase protein TatA